MGKNKKPTVKAIKDSVRRAKRRKVSAALRPFYAKVQRAKIAGEKNPLTVKDMLDIARVLFE